MTDTYRVTAPYITLRSKAESGGDVVLGYYRDALVPETVNLEDLARHIRKGMVEKLGGDEASAVEKGRAEARKAAGVQARPEDKEGAAAVRKAEAAKEAAKSAADREEADAAKEGKPLVRAADSKPGAKTAPAG